MVNQQRRRHARHPRLRQRRLPQPPVSRLLARGRQRASQPWRRHVRQRRPLRLRRVHGLAGLI